jgi:hypothetical protein
MQPWPLCSTRNAAEQKPERVKQQATTGLRGLLFQCST